MAACRPPRGQVLPLPAASRVQVASHGNQLLKGLSGCAIAGIIERSLTGKGVVPHGTHQLAYRPSREPASPEGQLKPACEAGVGERAAAATTAVAKGAQQGPPSGRTSSGPTRMTAGGGTRSSIRGAVARCTGGILVVEGPAGRYNRRAIELTFDAVPLPKGGAVPQTRTGKARL